MGTNFYFRRIPTEQEKQDIINLIADDKFDDANEILNESTKKIHLCKRSCGWQMGFDHNNGEYYYPSRTSLENFLRTSRGEIIDENGRTYSHFEFWKEVDSWNSNKYNNWDSSKDIEHNKLEGHIVYICKEDIKNVYNRFGIKTLVNDFYSEGLRFNVFTSFC